MGEKCTPAFLGIRKCSKRSCNVCVCKRARLPRPPQIRGEARARSRRESVFSIPVKLVMFKDRLRSTVEKTRCCLDRYSRTGNRTVDEYSALVPETAVQFPPRSLWKKLNLLSLSSREKVSVKYRQQQSSTHDAVVQHQSSLRMVQKGLVVGIYHDEAEQIVDVVFAPPDQFQRLTAQSLKSENRTEADGRRGQGVDGAKGRDRTKDARGGLLV